jgi:hypothetical protein
MPSGTDCGTKPFVHETLKSFGDIFAGFAKRNDTRLISLRLRKTGVLPMAELIKSGIVGSYKLNGHAESSGGTISTDIHAVNKAFALNRSYQTE